MPEKPGRVGISIGDIACGASARGGVLEALIERGRTGVGRAIEITLFEVIADWMNDPLLCSEGLGAMPRRVGLAHYLVSKAVRSARVLAFADLTASDVPTRRMRGIMPAWLR